ncbi:MAG TPA: TIGR04551 family protein, partial [Polyangia bacterium]
PPVSPSPCEKSIPLALLCFALALAAPRPAAATGFTDLGQDISRHTEMGVAFGGYFRLRTEGLYNLDLDRGLTPSGQPLFPVPLSDPTSQWLSHADMRLRTDVAFFAPGGALAVKLRVDVLDNLTLGSTPDGVPGFSNSQAPPRAAFRVKRAYGEAVTPVGLIVAGRTGNHWGLGMASNGGDCADCDSGDAADRVAFVTPLAGHVFAVAYDFTAVGPLVTRPAGYRAIDVEPSADVRTLTLAALRWRDERAINRRRRAGKTTVDYGLSYAYRWQGKDVPSTYLATTAPVPLTAGQVVPRDYTASSVDAWFRVIGPRFRVEAEGMVVLGRIEQTSLIPGVLMRDPVSARQIGAAVESEYGAPEDALGAGLDLGYASGDSAPGFGAFPAATGTCAKPGDLDGLQYCGARDTRIDNFRFHPDYHIDRILFREIIGTVTDAIYFRPHARVRLARLGPGTLHAAAAAVVSFAAAAESTPGGQRPLGVEVDPTLYYHARDGFNAALEYAVLFPLAGLDNPQAGLTAKPAQLVRLRLIYVY